MFMQRIEIPAVAAAKRKPAWMTIPVGFLFLLTCLVLMAGWSVVQLVWIAAALAARAIADAAGFVYELLVYSGEAVLGR
jgi:hypothetical protein